MSLNPGKRYAVFAIKKISGGGVLWTRAGNATFGKDGSLNIWLDVLPMEGRLHIRELAERAERAGDPRLQTPEPDSEPMPLLDSATAEAHP
ncbi:MAG: hypothetical protein M3Y59_07855 [Myxococcota bacterium]|nr:hypothetical protein [Myxococcota bacterium]